MTEKLDIESAVSIPVKGFLSTGENAEAFDGVVKTVLAEEDYQHLFAISSAVLDAAAETPAPPERMNPVTALAYTAEHLAGEFLVQRGKVNAQRIVPLHFQQLTNDHYFETRRKEWIYLSSDTSGMSRDARAEYRDIRGAKIRVRERRALSDLGKEMWKLRYEENAIRAEIERGAARQVQETSIPETLERLAKIAAYLADGRTKQKEISETAVLIGEDHLNDLFDLGQTYVGVLQAKTLTEEQMTLHYNILEERLKALLGDLSPTKVSESRSYSTVTSAAHIGRSIQRAIKGELREMRRDRMLEELVRNVVEINRNAREAVRLLQFLNDDLNHGITRLRDEMTALRGDVNSGFRHNFLGMAALGDVIGSFRANANAYADGGLFGGYSSTHMSIWPKIAFADAFRARIEGRVALPPLSLAGSLMA